MQEYPRHSHPGWNKGSIAYHADDGKIFVGSGAGDPFGPRCHRGDIMGCGIIFPRDFITSFDDERKNNKNQLRGEDAELLYHYSSDDPERLSQSSQSGAENDSSFDSDENSDADDSWKEEHWDDGWGDWGVEQNEIIPMEPKIAYRRNAKRMQIMQRKLPSYEKERNHETKGAKVQVFFTRNGVIIGQKDIHIPKGGFYPTVGMLSSAEKVKVDLHPLSG